jgi:hypothetical protein
MTQFDNSLVLLLITSVKSLNQLFFFDCSDFEFTVDCHCCFFFSCYEDCIEGHCSGWPNYTCICNIGWTGIDCSTDCGCNNHSTCTNGVNKCDVCLDWTTGDHCERCQPGSYGSATSLSG